MIDDLIRIVGYLVVGGVLLLANLWFARNVYVALSRPEFPSVIAPFEVVGKDDQGGRLGASLARLLAARLVGIREQAAASLKTLQSTEPPRRTDPPPAAPTGASGLNLVRVAAVAENLAASEPVTIPDRVFEPIDLELKVGGVEVGGVLAWLQRMFASDQSLKISVAYGDEQQATVAGLLDLHGKVSLHHTTKATNDDIVDHVAYSFVQHQVKRHIAELSALDVGEFKALLDSMSRLVDLNRQVAGGRVGKAGYEELLPKLKAVADKTPQWRQMNLLAAQVAENASSMPDALTYYARVRSLLPENDKTGPMLDKKIADLRTRLVMIDQTKLRALVGISSAATLKASIAVLSAEPSSHLWPNLDFETLHVAPEGAPASRHARDDFSLSRYSDELVASMQMVSPDARHYFVDNLRGSAITDSLLVAALLEAAKAKPSVILIPWGPLSAQTLGAIVPRLQHEHDVVLVVPAGNDPAQAPTLDGSSLADSMLVVGAVNGRGRIASFSSQGAKLAWAPGDGILPAQDGAAGPLRGTSFAAAVAAAMAGRLRAEFPAKKAPEIIAAMRSTAVPVDRGGPPVLNLDRAAAQLKAP